GLRGRAAGPVAVGDRAVGGGQRAREDRLPDLVRDLVPEVPRDGLDHRGIRFEAARHAPDRSDEPPRPRRVPELPRALVRARDAGAIPRRGGAVASPPHAPVMHLSFPHKEALPMKSTAMVSTGPRARSRAIVSRAGLVAAALATFALSSPAAAPSAVEQGRAALLRGDDDAAIAILEKAVAQTPKDAAAHLPLANAYRSQVQKG